MGQAAREFFKNKTFKLILFIQDYNILFILVCI